MPFWFSGKKNNLRKRKKMDQVIKKRKMDLELKSLGDMPEEMDQVIKKQKMGIALKCLEDLPEEIILKILGQVNIRDLFRCSSVNKKFREIAHDKSLWEKMNLHSKVDVPAELFAKLLEKGCEYLSVPVISNVQGTARFQNNLKLKYLSFRVSKSTKGLLEFAASCHSLEKLAFFWHSDIDQIAIGKLFKCIIQNSSTLKVLRIGPELDLSNESIRLIVTLCQGLTDLSISGIQISQVAMNFFWICMKIVPSDTVPSVIFMRS